MFFSILGSSSYTKGRANRFDRLWSRVLDTESEVEKYWNTYQSLLSEGQNSESNLTRDLADFTSYYTSAQMKLSGIEDSLLHARIKTHLTEAQRRYQKKDERGRKALESFRNHLKSSRDLNSALQIMSTLKLEVEEEKELNESTRELQQAIENLQQHMKKAKALLKKAENS